MSELQFLNTDYEEKYGFRDPEQYTARTEKGLSKEMVLAMCKMKDEPAYMVEIRLKALDVFMKKTMPSWGGNLKDIDFNKITYYIKPSDKMEKSWEQVPENIRKTFEKLGIPEAEKKFLGGVGAQYESESVYHKLREDLAAQGVIFTDMSEAVKKYPDLVKKYFGKVVPMGDNKFAALNTAVWSGGSFIYIPKGVKVTVPLQAYFRINAQNVGQFERTMIIADEGAEVNYIEGCFVKGTAIRTLDGTKPIEDIKTGEIVLTHTGSYKQVYNTQIRKYNGDLYTLRYTTDSRKHIKITSEHPLLIVPRQKAEYKNTHWAPQWVPAKNVAAGDYVVLPIERTVISKDERLFTIRFGKAGNNVDVLLKTDNDFCRLVGYYLAEGATINEHYLTFTFNKKERAYIDDVKFLLEKIFGKEPIEQAEYKNGVSVILCSTTAARIFKQQFGSGAHKKQIPLWMQLESPDKLAELIKGWFRGDGNQVQKIYSWGNKRMFRICTASSKLAEQMRNVLLKLNILASINVWKRKAPRTDLYVVYIGGAYFPEFAKQMDIEITAITTTTEGGQITQQLAKSLGLIEGDFAFVPIKSMHKESVQCLDVYNFSVEDDESYVSEGIIVHNCTAPTYSTDSLHAAVVEVIAEKNAKIRYTTIQNWSSNVYNLVTKRAFAYENAIVEWIDGNLGSKLTMKYPSVYLMGENAKADILSVAYAGKGQHQDAGGKAVHLAPNTTSRIISKSLSKDGGRGSYRGLVRIAKGATNATSTVRCDALILDDQSRSDTYPTIQIEEEDATIGHEAYVGKIGEEQLFYLMSRGLSEQEAMAMIVLGFIAEFTKELPMEYAIELNKLIRMEMEGGVG